MMFSTRFAVSTFAALASVLAFSSGGALAQTTVTSAPPASFTLGNGLQVVVIPDHRTPVVTQMIWYKVGSADETPGKSGLAHFLEHLMFKGTAKHPAGEFSQTVLRIGGNENAFTSLDYTGYFQRVPREQLAKMMEFEADRMTGLILKDENVLPERDVVLEEFNMRVANNPDARLTEQMMAALYLNHPYGRPVIGWRQEIEKLDREDALAFYKRFYAPNNAILVIAGDGYQGTSRDPTQFQMSVSPKPGVEFPEVEKAIDAVIADLAQNPARSEDLERVKTQLIAEAIYAQDNQATLARWYGGALTSGLSIADIRSWPERVRAVTAEQVRAAAQKWLDKKRSVTGYLIKDNSAKREEK